jgi:hypothetical protein
VNWKLVSAIVVVFVALAFGLRQFHVGWRERPPAAFQFRELRSPPLDPALRARLREWSREPVASLTLWQVGATGQPDRHGTLEPWRNGGLKPLQRFERSGRTNSPVIGFYTFNGEPLSFVEKRNPAHAEQLGWTVWLPAPLAPGATQWVLRVEQRWNRAPPNADGQHVARAAGVNPRQIGLHIRAIELPPGAQLVRVTPTGVMGPFFVWTAWDHETKPPLTVTYRLP